MHRSCVIAVFPVCYSGFSCSPGVDIDRVVRDAKRVFCNTPRTASMRRHDKLFADPNVKHVSQNHHLLFHRETFVVSSKNIALHYLVLYTHCVPAKLILACNNLSPADVVLATLAVFYFNCR